MEELLSYLESDDELLELMGGKYIFLVERPLEKNGLNTYITYNYKELKKYTHIEYQVDYYIISNDMNKALSIKNRLIELLDNMWGNIHIDGILETLLLNGGGIIKNNETDRWEIPIFFYVKK